MQAFRLEKRELCIDHTDQVECIHPESSTAVDRSNGILIIFPTCALSGPRVGAVRSGQVDGGRESLGRCEAGEGRRAGSAVPPRTRGRTFG